jgi:hypothetical protein
MFEKYIENIVFPLWLRLDFVLNLISIKILKLKTKKRSLACALWGEPHVQTQK